LETKVHLIHSIFDVSSITTYVEEKNEVLIMTRTTGESLSVSC